VQEKFVLVYVDVGRIDHNLDLAASLGVRGMKDTGIPILVVLDEHGAAAKVQDAGAFATADESGYSTAAVLAFLRASR